MYKQNIKTNARILTVLFVFLYVSAALFAAKIGIYPGSFDPVHVGHLEVARSALTRLGLDAVYIMPNGTNPRKPDMSQIEQRAALIESALSDYNDDRLHLFPVAEIEKSAAAGPVEEAPVRLLDLARRTFPNDCIFQILGTDSVFKVVENGRPDQINKNWKLAVCNRSGIEFAMDPTCSALQKKGLLITFDSFDSREISSSAIRKACKNGDFDFIASVLTPSTYQSLVKQGLYSTNLRKEWLEKLLQLPGDIIATDRHPMSEPVMLKQNYVFHPDLPEFATAYTAPLEEAVNIDFSAPHTMGDLRLYVQEKLTPAGMKILANPEVEVLIFPGDQQQLSHWLANQGISSGMKITRNRSFITLGIHLVQTRDGKFLAIVDEVYGKDRMRHTQALVAAAMHISGRKSDDFRVVVRKDGNFPADVHSIYAKELEPVKPGTISAAVIGFHWKVVNDLEKRHSLYKLTGNSRALACGEIANNWRRRLETLKCSIEKHAWPRRHFANQNIPFSFLAFKNDKGQPLNLLLTRNVYGDQLLALLQILIEEKKVDRIILFGNAGGLGSDSKIGDIVLPTEIKRFNTPWTRFHNSLADDLAITANHRTGRVYSVFSPLVETDEFIKNLKAENTLAVDVENGYLSEIAGYKLQDLGSIVVISDIPGSDETLADLEENEIIMESSLIESLDMIIRHLHLSGPSDHPFPIQ